MTEVGKKFCAPSKSFQLAEPVGDHAESSLDMQSGQEYNTEPGKTTRETPYVL